MIFELRKRGQYVQLVLAGSGDPTYTNELKDKVSKLDLDKNVHFTGYVAGVDKLSLYRLADIFVLPTSQENFGFVLFESLVTGTPVVTTKHVDTWPEIMDSGGGVILEQELELFVDAIENLMLDEKIRENMGEKGKQWVLDNLTDDVVIDQWVGQYSLAIESKALNG